MVINWYGEGCFKLQNGEISVITDLPDASSGLTPPRISTNVLLKTITAWPSEFAEETKADVTIIGAGEYDIKDVVIRGFQLKDESAQKYFKTAYVLTWDELKIGILGHLSQDFPPTISENFEELDVLIGPAGGSPFLETEKMAKLIKMLSPKIFIPSFYKVPGLKRKADDVKDFIELFGGEVDKDQEKFVFKKKEIQDLKKTKMVCLKI